MIVCHVIAGAIGLGGVPCERDVQGPCISQLIERIDEGGRALGVHGNYMYVGDSGSVRIYELSSEQSVFVTDFEVPSVGLDRDFARRIVSNGSTLAMSTFGGGVYAYDIEDHSQPELLGRLDNSGLSLDLATGSGLLFSASKSGRINIYNYSSEAPGTPELISGFDVEQANAIAYYSGYLYVYRTGGLWPVDVSNPLQADVKAFVEMDFEFGTSRTSAGDPTFNISDSGIAMIGRTLVDFSDRMVPVQVGSVPFVQRYNNLGRHTAVNSSGTVAIITSLFWGSTVWDISNPSMPALVQHYSSWPSILDQAGKGAKFSADGYACMLTERFAWVTDASRLVCGPLTADPDLNGDDVIGAEDLGIILAAWGTPNADLDGDFNTATGDLGVVLSSWGNCE